MPGNDKMTNTKKDFIWIIPEIIGSLGISVAAALHFEFKGD